MPNRKSAADEAASRAQRWTLVTGIAGSLLAGQVMERFGVRVAFAGLAGAVVMLGALVLLWRRGFPKPEPGVGHGGFWAIARQSPEVGRDIKGAFLLYASWGVMYPVVALLGAGPAVQASIASVAQLAAAVLVGLFGRLAGRNRRRVATLGTAFATAGVLGLAVCGPSDGWLPAGVGVAFGEVGFNAVGGTLKGSLASAGDERVRAMLAGFQARFVGAGLVSLSLTALWPALRSAAGPRYAIAFPIVVALIALLMIVPRPLLRAGKHAIDAPGHGQVVIAALSLLNDAQRNWFCVWVPSPNHNSAPGRIGRVFPMLPGERLPVRLIDSESEQRVVELQCLPSVRRQTVDPPANADVPLAGPPGVFERGLEMTARSADGPRRVGRLVKFTPHAVTVEARVVARDDYPAWLPAMVRRRLGHDPRMRQDVDVTGPVTLYIVVSDALRTRQHVTLRIRSYVYPWRRNAN
jgi:hypothetical protein